MNIPINTPKESGDYNLLITKSVLLTGDDPDAKRAEIKKYFNDTYTLYERLFDCLASDESFIPRRYPFDTR